jgi:hypothetical protein
LDACECIFACALRRPQASPRRLPTRTQRPASSDTNAAVAQRFPSLTICTWPFWLMLCIIFVTVPILRKTAYPDIVGIPQF